MTIWEGKNWRKNSNEIFLVILKHCEIEDIKRCNQKVVKLEKNRKIKISSVARSKVRTEGEK